MGTGGKILLVTAVLMASTFMFGMGVVSTREHEGQAIAKKMGCEYIGYDHWGHVFDCNGILTIKAID